MPIIGIDQSKCIQCRLCEKDCLASCYTWDEQEKQMKFDNLREKCLECGHCIACCPTNAILYEKMGNTPAEFLENKQPLPLPSFDSLNRLLQRKRSTRHYKTTKISPEIIRKVQLALSYAPTGSNARNMKCQILDDSSQIQALSEAVIDTLIASPLATDDYRDFLRERKKSGRDSIFFKAPLVFIIHGEGEADTVNSAIAITYAMLAAETLGLGSCWIGLAHMAMVANKEARVNIAKIPDKIWGVFTLGYPDVKFVRGAPRHELP